MSTYILELEKENDRLSAELARVTAERDVLVSVTQDHDRLVRELDVALNGETGAAKQASLCDVVSQVKKLGNGDWLLVPKEPTKKMKACGESNWSRFCGDGDVHDAAARLYRAMLAAAPKPEV